jgi:MFS family permease
LQSPYSPGDKGAFPFQPLYRNNLEPTLSHRRYRVVRPAATRRIFQLDTSPPRQATSLWAAWIVGAVTIWIMVLATTLPVFVAGMFIYSTTSFVLAPLSSYVAAARGKWSVGRVLTLVSASYNGGAILGPSLGGMIGDRFGYRTIFVW